MTIILGLESSCDETAAALVTADRRILAHALAGQADSHAPFGGVVPEIAAREGLGPGRGLQRGGLGRGQLRQQVFARAACGGRGRAKGKTKEQGGEKGKNFHGRRLAQAAG